MRRSSTHAIRSEARVPPGFSFWVGLAMAALTCSTSCGQSSRDACESYVVHVGGLSCTDRDPPTCSVDEETCSRARYWSCLEEGTSCTDAGLLVEETEACDPACRAE